MQITELKCNHLVNPIGVETTCPQLSWVLKSNERNQVQAAYRVIVASQPELLHDDVGDLWDTGIVYSDRSIHLAYAGEQLFSRQKLFWKVCVWDQDNQASNWSEIAYWEMGLLHQAHWTAKWIGSPKGKSEAGKAIPAPLFRKKIEITKKVADARVYISGLGFHELYIDGDKVGNEKLSPGFTQYDVTVLYNSHDITYALNEGHHVLGMILGNGWYNQFTQNSWNFNYAAWRDQPKFILQVYIRYSDGEETLIKSDPSWKTGDSPINFDALRNGEHYDARLENPYWCNSDYDDSSWDNAIIVRSPGGLLVSDQMNPIRVTDTIKPIGLHEVKQGVWVYDLGQNISGWARLQVSGPAGTVITIAYAEKISDKGDIITEDMNMHIKSGEFQTDQYVLNGVGEEIWEPRFVYHGFQYIQIIGFPGVPSLENISGQVVHTDLETRGEFECSNALLNSIHSCVRRSTLTNYHSIPTDCPHREKNGWTGDANLSAEQVLYNFDPMATYAKWMRDFKDAQRPDGQLPGIIPTGGWGFTWGNGPAWDSALVLIPWHVYEYVGDTSILSEMYPHMKRYVNYLIDMSDKLVVDFGLGDWCPPGNDPFAHDCPVAVTDTAYFFKVTQTLSRIAEIIGETQDATAYRKLSAQIREAFRQEFFDAKTGKIAGDSQTSYACALYQGLVNEEEEHLVLQKLAEQIEAKNMHLNCGILGAKYVMHALTRMGRVDLAYTLATQTTYPSWGDWILRGATTLWEQWNGEGSRNHHMFSDIGAWFYKALAGIKPDIDEPGFKHVVLSPHPVPGLDWVKASHRSMYGTIESNWQKIGNRFKWEIVIPVNCRATVHIPEPYTGSLLESGKPWASSLDAVNDDPIQLYLGSGAYCFEATSSENLKVN